MRSMKPQFSAQAHRWLERHTKLNADQRAALAALAPSLMAHLPDGSPWLLGLGGPPGTGKSTLAGLLAHLASLDTADDAPPGTEHEPEHAPGLGQGPEPGYAPAPVIVISLDDYYLPKAQRLQMAATDHPLWAHRGVPGTHDTALLLRHLDQLLAGEAPRTPLPRFDKSRDDRLTEAKTLPATGIPARVILEGWFVGLPPEPPRALTPALSALERRADANGHWRRQVNAELGEFAHQLGQRLTACWQLLPPGWPEVLAWRWQQEKDLPVAQRRLSGPAEVADFLAPFERLCRHQLTLDGRGQDLLLRLDEHHLPHLDRPS